jgi:uncharacterized protein
MKKLLIPFLIACIFIACKSSKNMAATQNISVHAFRLKPGQDLRKEIELYVKENNIAAGWIATCVGSLTNYNIRFANQQNGNTGNGHFEIVSLTGTVSTNGSHIHISISDSTGNTIGGHLLQGNIVYTTAEIVIQSSSNLFFKREKDGSTPWEELQVEKK